VLGLFGGLLLCREWRLPEVKSCALKLAMPISVLSAVREANEYRITVKGGKFLEALAEADTIVFDKSFPCGIPVKFCRGIYP